MEQGGRVLARLVLERVEVEHYWATLVDLVLGY